jgi:hypothetical protein
MSRKRQEAAIGAAVDARAEELIAELRTYTEKCINEVTGSDARNVFESWVIQKLAGIQLIVEQQNAAVNELLRRAGLE